MGKKALVRTETGEVEEVKSMLPAGLVDAFGCHIGFVKGIVALLNNADNPGPLGNLGYVLNDVEDRLEYMDIIANEMFLRLTVNEKDKAA